ncbi:MAG: rane protein [Rubritepida sp.]|nr:rane protein [Rubritepida sp.]
MTDTPASGEPRGGSRTNIRDQIAGMLFVLLGAAIAYKARSYTVGPPSNSGAGFFPFYLGLLLVGLGVAITAVASFKHDPDAERFSMHPRTFLGVLLPVVIFGITLVPAGLVLSAFIAVMLSSYASPEVTFRGALLNAAVLSVIVLVGFAMILGIQIPVWPNVLIEWLR